MTAIKLSATHDSKHAPWGGDTEDGDVIVYGVDWSAAAFVWAFTDAYGTSPDITLVNAAAGTQGVSATYDALAVSPETGAVVGATTIRPLITEATLEALTWPSPVSASLVLYSDLLITPVGQQQMVYATLNLTIKPGVGD